MHEKHGHSMVSGFGIKMIVKSYAIDIIFKSWGPLELKKILPWGPFRIYLLISTDNPAQITPKGLDRLCHLADRS